MVQLPSLDIDLWADRYALNIGPKEAGSWGQAFASLGQS